MPDGDGTWTARSRSMLQRADGAALYSAVTVRAGRKVRMWRAARGGSLYDGPDWCGPWRTTRRRAEQDLLP